MKKNIYENIKENTKDTTELSSLERTAEPSARIAQSTYRRKINNIIKII